MATKFPHQNSAKLRRSLPERHLSSFRVSAENKGMVSEVLRAKYRCPEEFAVFRLAGELSGSAKFFEFGAGVTCYGRVADGFSKAKKEFVSDDPYPGVAIEGQNVVLPFDPDEVIENLRLERYAEGQWSPWVRALKRIYYWARPLTNLSIRRQIKKFYSASRDETSFPHWPVDTTVENLCEKLLLLAMQAKGTDRIPFVWFWPRGASGCVTMTHDVETAAGRDFCGELMDINDTFGVKASFEIVPEKRYEVPRKFLQGIRERGFEIAVQDLNHDGRLFDDREKFRRRAQRINRYGREFGATGFRAAVLYRKPEWYGDLDFSYDMSMPNVAPLDPQRGGCCSVMPYFIGNLLEIPVTMAQDYTLFYLLNARTIDLWKVQVERILAKSGLANFIVHPDYITEPNRKSIYEALLGWLREIQKERGLWFAMPHEIDQWWRVRDRMSVAKDKGVQSWKITGDGSEHAVLAFAKEKDGRLVYELAGSPAV